MNPSTSIQHHSVNYGSKIIDFELTTTKRRTLGISVYPNLSVKVVAPHGATLETITSKIKKKASWIVRKQEYFSDFLPPPTPKRYVSGESFYYLGKQYRLKVSKGSRAAITRNGKYLQVQLPKSRTPKDVKNTLEHWFRSQAEVVLLKRAAKCQKLLRHISPKPDKVIIKRMMTRWGSLTPSQVVVLNQDLIHYPSQCIDYVIVHELCHLVVKNHNEKFFRLLTKYLPDWESRKQRLSRFTADE